MKLVCRNNTPIILIFSTYIDYKYLTLSDFTVLYSIINYHTLPYHTPCVNFTEVIYRLYIVMSHLVPDLL